MPDDDLRPDPAGSTGLALPGVDAEEAQSSSLPGATTQTLQQWRSPLELERAELVAEAQDLIGASQAPSTVRAYARVLRDYEAWTSSRGLAWSSLEAVALYVTWRAKEGRTPSTIEQDLAAIGGRFQREGLSSPQSALAISRLRAGIRRRKGVAPKRVAPVLPEDLERMVAALPEGLLGIRDRALLLLGFVGAFRRSELASLRVEDLERAPGGLVVTLRRSKTDQEGEGTTLGIPYGTRPETCPVIAVELWLEASGLGSGPLFRRVTRHEVVGEEPLDPGSIARAIKRAARAAGLEPATVSGHSLRAGFVTAACKASRRLEDIMRQTRHRKLETLAAYVRKAGVFEDNAAKGLL